MDCENHSKTVNTVEALQESICQYARYTLGKHCDRLPDRDILLATTLAVRERLLDAMLRTEERYRQADAKRLYYLSMEFLMGRALANSLINLGILDPCREALSRMGYDLEEAAEKEPDAALGNGGLGRLAACFLDSLATMGMPGFGYGINYEYGLFKQEIENGYQKERPDHWLAEGTPWEIKRPDEACVIPVYGKVEHDREREQNNQYEPKWTDWKVVIGIPHDMPIVGFGGESVNYLRLFSARSSHAFDMNIFNQGDYLKAVEQKIATETISKVLYPSDSVKAGRELRLLQEYFLVACAIRDIIKHYEKEHQGFDHFASKVAIQLNDTHPALGVAELMRALLDDKDLPWVKAWEITRATFGYTNHTLLPEALEKWPTALLEYVLPRHLQIIQEINRRFLREVLEVWPGDTERLARMSIVEEGEQQQVRMAHLAIVGSHSVNGVAALHSELVKTSLVPDFYHLWPDKFNNKTNGVTQRRWLLKANPRLAQLITDRLGDHWITDLGALKGLELYAPVQDFQEEFLQIKRANKERLALSIRDAVGLAVDPSALFDVHVKRIHEYKRQLLNCMHIVHQYLSIIEDGETLDVPRTYIFAGKAAPGYWAAKQIIKLINSIGRVINSDARAGGQLKVVFIPDYRVSLAEIIIPAADLSEQISTAGMEASGTGNMKLAMNGALTMGTLDGANIEILEEVGEENIFIFGLKADEIQRMRRQGEYHPRGLYESDPRLRRVCDAFKSDIFCLDEPGLFTWIYKSLVEQGDYYFHLADLPSYIEEQQRASALFLQPQAWAHKAILNVARIGKFSSDRTVREYAEEIWEIKSHTGSGHEDGERGGLSGLPTGEVTELPSQSG